MTTIKNETRVVLENKVFSIFEEYGYNVNKENSLSCENWRFKYCALFIFEKTGRNPTQISNKTLAKTNLFDHICDNIDKLSDVDLLDLLTLIIRGIYRQG